MSYPDMSWLALTLLKFADFKVIEPYLNSLKMSALMLIFKKLASKISKDLEYINPPLSTGIITLLSYTLEYYLFIVELVTFCFIVFRKSVYGLDKIVSTFRFFIII